jgi:four helix bundle protein
VPLRNFRELDVWRRAFEFCRRIYAATAQFPMDERFGLTSQLRRAAVSVASNIAEGYNRGSTSDYVRFLNMARGSTAEIQTQLLLAQALGFSEHALIEPMLDDIAAIERMLAAMIRSLRTREAK